jgi:hypothetical protein
MIDFGLLKVLENTVISNIRDNELIEDLDNVYRLDIIIVWINI